MKKTPTPEPASKPKDEPKTVSRMSLTLDDAGNIAVDRLQDGTRDKLRAALSNPDTRRALGLTPDEPSAASGLPAAKNYSPLLVMSAAFLLSEINVMIVERVTKAPKELTDATRLTPEQQAQLHEPLSAVMSKYLPDVASKYDAEITLIGLFGMMTFNNIQAVRRAQHEPKGPASIINFPPPATPPPGAPPEPPPDPDARTGQSEES